MHDHVLLVIYILMFAIGRVSLRDYLDLESIALVKSDILSYGVLLLRLFCKTSVPQDDKTLLDWVSCSNLMPN